MTSQNFRRTDSERRFQEGLITVCLTVGHIINFEESKKKFANEPFF